MITHHLQLIQTDQTLLVHSVIQFFPPNILLHPLCPSPHLPLSPRLSQRMAELCREREGRADSTTALLGSHNEEPPQGLALQLADSKAKLRRLKQQL